jgi:hypothetical protein
LVDVELVEPAPNDTLNPTSVSQFRASRWFTRGWTLQELLASRWAVFFAKDWKVFGVCIRSWASRDDRWMSYFSRAPDLIDHVVDATGIRALDLEGFNPLSVTACVA